MSASRWQSYCDVDAAADPGSLGDQLDEIAAVPFVAAEKQRSLELLELSGGDSVLDVGCGTGPELERMAEIVGPSGRVVGLDRSLALIGRARGCGLARGPIELVHGDAIALPFGAGEFDACRADRTLQHVAVPEAPLAEMVRVTRASGRVVVTESRWGLVAPALDQVGRGDFFRFTHLGDSAEAAARSGELTPGEAKAWVHALSDLLTRGEAFAMVLFLHLVGVRAAT